MLAHICLESQAKLVKPQGATLENESHRSRSKTAEGCHQENLSCNLPARVTGENCIWNMLKKFFSYVLGQSTSR